MTISISLQDQIKALWQIQTIDRNALLAPGNEASAERAALLQQLPGSLLSQYERIRKARQGVGLASPQGSRCSACNIMLPPQLYNEIMRTTQIHSCPSCLRLLAVQPD